MSKKFRITLQADLETDNYNENRMDTSICFIANNTHDVIENFNNYLDLLKKCGLQESSVFELQESKFNPCVTDVI
tara:strand:- start:1112 stop:1336 length:225 start_codon:yes stop_codon:yes gene_type:complete